jgi:hypothetical protein
MRNVIDIVGNSGITVGLRKDDSVAVMYDNNQIIWFDAELFAQMIEVV